MAFRDDLVALEARHDALASELADKTRQLQQAAQLLDEAKHRAKLPVLDHVSVAAPCDADWQQMSIVDGERVRHCGDCKKNVYNLSELTRDEAEALLVEHEGKLCVRYYRRGDGTILTKDCPVGVARRRRRRLVAAGAAAMLVGGAALVWRVVRGNELRPDAIDVQMLTVEDMRATEEQVEIEVMPPPPPPAPDPREVYTVTAGAVAPTADFEAALRDAQKRKARLERRLEQLRRAEREKGKR